MRIALTGGIACGKSEIAKFLRELGIRLLDADDVVHELEAPGGEAVQMIRSQFGSSVIAEDGSVNRPVMAQLAFSDDLARRKLESILFPLVRERLLQFVLKGRSDSTLVHDSQSVTASGLACCSGEIRISVIPLLFESHWEGDYDTIIAIVSPRDVQIDRMMKTRGYTREQAEARLAAQIPSSEKAARAHYVVANNSTQDHLKEEARRLYVWLKERAKHEH